MENSDHSSKGPLNNTNLPPKKTSEVAGDARLLADAEYQQLMIEYQNARWEECGHLLENLLKKYPNHPRLVEFKRDFEFQFSFHQNIETSELKQKKEQRQTGTRRGMIIAAAILGGILLIWGGYALLHSLSVKQQENYAKTQIGLLGPQVEALLVSGQPEKAFTLVEQMKALDPEDARVIELAAKTDDLLKINAVYTEALAKIESGADAEALVLLQQVDASVTGYRDVKQLITETQNRIEIAKSIEESTVAYNESRWEDAITGFEKVFALDPTMKDETVKELLLNSYLRRIIQMLESDQTSVEDIDKAETYYRRAIAMIPQSRAYATERENLQKISSSLLELKYTQTAYAMISDPNQTLNTVSRAANYLNKAFTLNPKDSILKSEVDKINMYQVGLQDYVEMNWAPAIEQLTTLLSIDRNYADGLAAQLLYEAHVGRGKQYFSAGLYLDARKEYEAAETLAWEEENNKMKLFMVELDLGYTLGKLKDYQNAASYFKYAVETINYAYRANGDPQLILDLANAVQNYNDGSYLTSYEAFVSALERKNSLFSVKELNTQQGTVLAFVAAANQSCVQAVTEYNQLTRMPVVTIDQMLMIPSLP